MIMKYPVLIHKSEYGYDAHVPSLPGCHSQGETETDVLENIKDAIGVYLQADEEYVRGAELREVEVQFA